MQRYTHKEIEAKWQGAWREQGLYEVQDIVKGKENEYLLVEFPYPSGNLHVGHWYAFAVPDIYARLKRMQGRNVLYPMGFDAFGLPAENAAIKNKINPRTWTEENMAHMRTQIASMGTSFDTSREVVTCDPTYYRWTQWLFIQLFHAGLVEQRDTDVNWCPKDKTVLANEQVVNGHCERCDAEVEKKKMKQWNIKITQYADRLIDDLEDLDWPEEIKHSQRNWIGRSNGAEIDFAITNSEKKIKVFTTRPDTLFGATYMVLAPEHELVQTLKERIANFDDVATYIKEAAKKSEIERTNDTKEKTGVKLEGVTAINPANDEEIPIYIADYVLAGYGTGAIMAVPAHDERDHAFATKYEISITQVVAPYTVVIGREAPRTEENIVEFRASTIILKHWSEDKYYVVEFTKDNHRFLGGSVDDGETVKETSLREAVEESGYTDLEYEAEIFEYAIGRGYKTRKSREEICFDSAHVIRVTSDARIAIEDKKTKDCGAWYTAEEIIADSAFANDHKIFFEHYKEGKQYIGDGVLVNSGDFDGMDSEEAKRKITEHVGGKMTKTYKLRDWTVSRQRYWGVPIPMIHCDVCGAVPVADENLPVELPDVEDYLPSGDGESPLARVEEFVNVACPSCGKDARRETDTFDTFVDSSWYFLRYADPKNANAFADPEKLAAWMPVDLYSGGAEHTTMHVLYSRFFHKALFDLGLVNEKEPYTHRMNRGLILGPDGNKMSKSKGNVIDPDDIIHELGADTMRIYLAFVGPYNETGSYPWNPESIVGVRRFLERVWKLQGKLQGKIVDGKALENVEEIDRELHKTLKQVTESISGFKMNTGVAALMSCVNVLEKADVLTKEQLAFFVQMLSPYAPHMAEELWQGTLGNTESVHRSAWPELDEAALVSDEIELIVQVNGKVRDKIIVSADIDEGGAKAAALASEKVQKFIDGAEPKKIIYVPGRLISIVV